MAIASILHRISGVVLMLLMPFILFMLGKSLHSEEAFMQTKGLLSVPYIQVLVWGFSAALTYHLLAGIRHILMDLGIGEELHEGRRSAVVVILLAVIMAIFLGIWIW
jgi:succinate dehydrogenase / fumarate reductase, cytochrome b subunit